MSTEAEQDERIWVVDGTAAVLAVLVDRDVYEEEMLAEREAVEAAIKLAHAQERRFYNQRMQLIKRLDGIESQEIDERGY